MPADDYIPTPPYQVLAPTAMLDRGHVVDRRGRCAVCGERRPERGGWDVACRPGKAKAAELAPDGIVTRPTRGRRAAK
jgi:hypothetical protein